MKTSHIGRIMGDSHYNRIILFLYFSGRKSKTEIYNKISSNSRMPQKLEFLLEEGYISMIREGTSDHPRNIIDLTAKGQRLAEGLCELEESMGGSVEAMRNSFSDKMFEGECQW